MRPTADAQDDGGYGERRKSVCESEVAPPTTLPFCRLFLSFCHFVFIGTSFEIMGYRISKKVRNNREADDE